MRYHRSVMKGFGRRLVLGSLLAGACDPPAGDPPSGSSTTTGIEGSETSEPTGATASTSGAGPETSGSSGGEPGAASSSGGEPGPPGADTVPGGGQIECGNQVLPFTPPLHTAGLDAQDAYWMMWLARRTALFGQPEVPAELAALGLDGYEEIEASALGLQVFVVSNDDAVFVVFRGSQDVTDWLVNFAFAQVDGRFHGLEGQLHLGFATALGAAWGDIVDAVESRAGEGTPVWVTGHSLGGALATLASVRLSRRGLNVAPVYVFGQPRAGDREFAEAAHEQLGGRLYRFVNERDLVPRVPPSGDAAAPASAVLPLGGGLTEPLISELDYHHLGTMLQLVEDDVIEFPPMDDAEDVAYWEAVDGEGWLALVSATEVGTWHLDDRYLCRLRRWAFGS